MTTIPDYLPRLSRGKGDGVNKLCAMQYVSFINGDTEITDYPACSARPLSRMVQVVNDRLAGVDGFLSPQDAMAVIELGKLTVGTACVPDSVVLAWLAELLDSDWGVASWAGAAVGQVRRVAALLRGLSAGDAVTIDAVWLAVDALHTATLDAIYAVDSSAHDAAWTAYAAACAAYAIVRSDNAAGINTCAEDTSGTAARRAIHFGLAGMLQFTRSAILAWRSLAGMDAPAEMQSA